MKTYKNIWLLNIGEPLPVEGNRLHRMCAWKEKLTQLGHRVLFFTTDFEHQRKQWIKSAPKGYILLPSFISYKNNISIARLLNHFIISISFIFKLRKIKEKPDLILVSYPTILLALVAVIFGKKNGVKVIVDIRDKWPDIFLVHPSFKIFLLPLFWIKDYIVKNADEIIAVSPGYYQWAQRDTMVQQSHVLPLSFSAKINTTDRVVSTDQPIKLVFVGTLGKTYDLDSILHIYDLLDDSNINFQINVCGDGPEREKFITKIKTRDKIQMLGWLNKVQLDKNLNEAHIGLMLYHSDSPQGWPNKLLEYMANGLPIINTLNGESWHLIQEENLGINIKKNDLISLSKWIYELQHNPDLYKFYSSNNLNTYQNRFSEEKNFELLVQLITK